MPRKGNTSPILGLPSLEEHETDLHGERVSEGMRAQSKLRVARTLRNLKTRQLRWKGERGRYQHTRNERKRRFRKKLDKMAYLNWGLLEPVKGAGHKVAAYELWALRMNFISLGWNPSTGSLDNEVPSGRWDLDEPDWLHLWAGWPEDLRLQYRVERVSKTSEFSKENLTITKRPR